jgi:MFS family permease
MAATSIPRPTWVTTTFPALGSHHFRRFWLGMLPAIMANQMGMIATGYAAFTLTGSATVLGFVSSAMSLPMLMFSLVGGVVADRAARRRVILASQSAMCISAILVAALSFSGRLEVWHLVAFGLVQGAGFSFNMPARQAYVADLVGPSLLRSAISLQNAGMNFNRIAGPSLAGMLLAFPLLGVGGTFTVMTVLYCLAISTVMGLPLGRPKLAPDPTRSTNPLGQLLEGLQYLKSSPPILLVLLVGFFPMVISMPYQTLLPLFAERVHGMGAQGLGILSAGAGVGALTGSLGIAASTRYRAPARLQMLAGAGLGLSLIGYGLAPIFWLAVLMVAVVGFMSASFMALNNTLIMTNTDPRLYGRVMSVYLLTFGFAPLATIPAGWLADQIGGPITVAGSGAIVTVVILLATIFPPYRRYHLNHKVETGHDVGPTEIASSAGTGAVAS